MLNTILIIHPIAKDVTATPILINSISENILLNGISLTIEIKNVRTEITKITLINITIIAVG